MHSVYASDLGSDPKLAEINGKMPTDFPGLWLKPSVHLGRDHSGHSPEGDIFTSNQKKIIYPLLYVRLDFYILSSEVV